MLCPIAFSHIGFFVADIGKAIEFYREVFGWYHLAGPWPIKRESPKTDFTDTVYGVNWTVFKLAHMSTADHVGIELVEIELVDSIGSYDAKEWEHKGSGLFNCGRFGLFHFGITVPDFQEFLDRLVAHGGKVRTPINTIQKTDAAGNHFKVVFAEDPFGNVFEIYTHSYEVLSRL
jgi:catechol 2,3-dioxygenase-like lactoylglutathione lyase family enzyme